MFVIKKFVVLLCIFPVTYVSFVHADFMIETVQKHNVSIEKHYVTTPDGYILSLYNIPPKNKAKNGTKVIFMMHGLFSASPSYVLFPKESAGYYFHEHGYDVWMGNGRGNTYSRNHTHLDPEKSDFWKFSWHEIGAIDTPTMIDYTLKQTKQEKLICFGHSQGATVIFVLLSERPEYNDKISSIHMLASSVISRESSLPMLLFANNINRVATLAEANDVYEVLSHEDSDNTMKTLGEVCADPAVTDICKNILEFLSGPFSKNGYSRNLISNVAAMGIPAGASIRQVVHYGQCFWSGNFQKYDHGREENLKLYGTEFPPEYNLSNINTNVHIMYGTNDYIVLESNTPYLIRSLKNAKRMRKDRMESLNHFDFMIHPQLQRVMKRTLKRIKQFEED